MAAPDCPLVIVVAAALIRRGSLDPARLPGSDSIRAEIMEAFRDAMTAGATTATRTCAGRCCKLSPRFSRSGLIRTNSARRCQNSLSGLSTR